jgi:predicted Zn-dependent protease with MMP-like domain
VPLARLEPGSPGGPAGIAGPGAASADAAARPPRIVVYRRPLMARADGDDDLDELVFEVVVEEFARLLGVDPEEVDPGYPGED